MINDASRTRAAEELELSNVERLAGDMHLAEQMWVSMCEAFEDQDHPVIQGARSDYEHAVEQIIQALAANSRDLAAKLTVALSLAREAGEENLLAIIGSALSDVALLRWAERREMERRADEAADVTRMAEDSRSAPAPAVKAEMIRPSQPRKGGPDQRPKRSGETDAAGDPAVGAASWSAS